MDSEHKLNINNITCNDLYKSPMRKKDVSKINDSVYNELDEHVDTISDSSKQVDPINDPTAETHIVDGVCTLSVIVGLFELAVVVGGIIRPVMNKLENLSVELPLGLQYNSVGVIRKILNCTLLDSRNIRQNNSRIGSQGVNKGIFSPSRNTTSSLWSCMGKIKPLENSIQGSATQERNLDLSCIEKVGEKVSSVKSSLILTLANG